MMDYPIDYTHYSTSEIIDIVQFLNHIEQYHASTKPINLKHIIQQYQRYQAIINNKAEEKKIDKAFQKQTNHSIYHTMQEIIKKTDSVK